MDRSNFPMQRMNDTTAQNINSGRQTNGKLKQNMFISKYKIHKVVKYSVKRCTLINISHCKIQCKERYTNKHITVMII